MQLFRFLPFLKVVSHLAEVSFDKMANVGTLYINPVLGGNLKVKLEIMTFTSDPSTSGMPSMVNLNPRQSK